MTDRRNERDEERKRAEDDERRREDKERRSDDLKEAWRRHHPSEQDEGGKGRPGRRGRPA